MVVVIYYLDYYVVVSRIWFMPVVEASMLVQSTVFALIAGV